MPLIANDSNKDTTCPAHGAESSSPTEAMSSRLSSSFRLVDFFGLGGAMPEEAGWLRVTERG